jgi:hypothetical protein
MRNEEILTGSIEPVTLKEIHTRVLGFKKRIDRNRNSS